VLPRYLLDTNNVSYLLKGQAPPVRARFERETVDAIAISAVTEAEILYGLAKIPGSPQLRLAVDLFLASVTRLAWDSPAARSYAALRTKQEHKGKPLSAEDMFIAAQSMATGLTLVTHDRVFSFVDGLSTEDWTVA
jgi:tRNA(fMet)-specific endonuclease VapC